jgi:transposase
MAAVDAGMSKAQAARIFGVDEETIRRYVIRRRETGSLDPRPHPGRSPLIRPEQREVLWTQLVEHPTATLREHCALWAARTGMRIAVPTMSREIRRLGWTRKKDRWVPPSGTRPRAVSGIGS